jgi:hypothetical protein
MNRRLSLTRCVAIALAVCLAGQPAWGHSFPPVRTVVVQVERCELAVLIGFRPGSGESTEALLKQIASQPKSQMLGAAKTLLTAMAMGPLTFSIDGRALVPTSVRAKIGADPSGQKPLLVALVTFAIPERGGSLSVSSRDARTTRISWTDRASGRVDPTTSPGQNRWFTGVASFLLTLAGPTGVPACATSSSSSQSSQQ